MSAKQIEEIRADLHLLRATLRSAAIQVADVQDRLDELERKLADSGTDRESMARSSARRRTEGR